MKLVMITIKENIELALQRTCKEEKREQHIAKVAEKQGKILTVEKIQATCCQCFRIDEYFVKNQAVTQVRKNYR